MANKLYILFPILYAVSNAFSFTLYGLDKSRAKRKNWRISEHILLGASLVGPIGAWLGMQRFRHKTQKPIFKYLVPLFLWIHIAFVVWINL